MFASGGGLNQPEGLAFGPDGNLYVSSFNTNEVLRTMGQQGRLFMSSCPQAMGPWDRQPVRSAGRLANYLDLHAWHFAALALEGVAPRNYRKNPKSFQSQDLRRQKAA